MISKSYKFSLSDTQYEKLERWYDELINRKNNGSHYFGAIGGELTFTITPTSVGSFVTATCLGESVDLSEV